MANQTNPSHDEIWDDSALVDSWNQALDEYKRYHSIHADKAAKLDHVPDCKKTGRNAKTETNEPPAPSEAGEEGQDGETFSAIAAHEPKTEAAESGRGSQQGGGVPSPPVAVLGSMQDEGLKALLMSWYYAGYYTGLYEGQQKQQQQERQ